MTEVVIYTDGACSGNPGPGGWGVVLRWQDTEKELYGGDPQTTNNRMELMAAIQALETLQGPATVNLHTDSKYLLDGITKWIKGWERNGWMTSAKKPVKNADLWRSLRIMDLDPGSASCIFGPLFPINRAYTFCSLLSG